MSILIDERSRIRIDEREGACPGQAKLRTQAASCSDAEHVFGRMGLNGDAVNPLCAERGINRPAIDLEQPARIAFGIDGCPLADEGLRVLDNRRRRDGSASANHASTEPRLTRDD